MKGTATMANAKAPTRILHVDGDSFFASCEIALHPDPPLADEERIHVGSLLPRPDGSLLVFFAKETAVTRAATWGPLVDRSTAIYSETVRP